MPRPRLCRRVGFQPKITYFKPAGIRITDLNESILALDEFESVRLKDLECLDQEECAKKMNISQPTFHRLVLAARKKIADALVNGKAIKIEGGVFEMALTGTGRMGRGMGFGGPATMCKCPNCGLQESKERGIPCTSKKCPKCGSALIRSN